jgi:hypothetical protein
LPWIRQGKGGETVGKLAEKFLKNKWQYLRRKHQCTIKNEREKVNRVLNFLKFCEKMGCEDFRDIKKVHYDRYVLEVLNKKATETKRKHLLTLKEFFGRAHIQVQINPGRNIKRTKEYKLEKLLQILNLDIKTLTKEQVKQILRLL